jgi:hypothetical protein
MLNEPWGRGERRNEFRVTPDMDLPNVEFCRINIPEDANKVRDRAA